MMLVASSPVMLLSFVLVLSTSAAGWAGQRSLETSSLQSEAPQIPRGAAGMIEFYRSVHAFTQSPPVHRELVRVCEARFDERSFVTILGVAHADKPLIIALTKERLAKPSQDISLVTIYAQRAGGLPRPVAYDPRSATATVNWAYIFDRNSDGMIDYFAYLESAAPVRPVDHKGEVPSLRGTIGKDAVIALIKNARMVFWHVADWNCDGREDAAMVPLRDEGNGWVDSRLLAMDADFDGEYEWCSVLDQALGGEPYPCEKGDGRYRAPGKELLGIPEVPPRGSMLDVINKGVAECGLKGSAFYREPDELRRELAAEP